MKKYTLIGRCAALAMALSMGIATTYGVTVTGNVVDAGQLMSGTNLNNGGIQSDNVKVFLESSNTTLASGLFVNRIGPDFGNFTNAGDGSGTIAAGTMVTDYLLHYNHPGTANSNNATGTVTFDEQIIGLIVFTGALNNSDGQLGVTGVSYPTSDQFRGLDTSAVNGGAGNDGFSVSGDALTFNINGWTTTNQVDEVRVILAVPDGGSTAALLGISALGLLGLFKLRSKNLA